MTLKQQSKLNELLGKGYRVAGQHELPSGATRRNVYIVFSGNAQVRFKIEESGDIRAY